MKRLVEQPPKPLHARALFFWPTGLVIILLGACARLWEIANHPGWEWDEGVYVYIARNLAENGQLAFKTDYLAQTEAYLYHPPFHFMLLAGWFKLVGAGITEARVFAVLGAVVTMTLVLVLLRKIIGNAWALTGVALLAADTWLNFSQRVAWIENTLIPIGVLGLLLYVLALERNRSLLYAVAGFVLGFAAVYKHVGVIFLGTLVIHTLLIRKNWRKDLVAISTALGVIVTYVATAALLFGSTFIHASTVQFTRSTGEQTSGGALNSLSDILGPLLSQYKIYVATMGLAGVAVALVLYRLVQIIRHRGDASSVRSISVLYAWALAAVVFFVGLQLRFPHYSMLAFIPLFCYLVAEASRYVRTKRQFMATWAVGVLILAANAFAFQARFVTTGNDSALRDVQQFATEHIPLDAKVIADESTGAVIPQQFCTMWQGKDCVGATYIIVYRSSTQKFENNNGQLELIDSSVLVFKTQGFKEEISVYQLPTAVTKP